MHKTLANRPALGIAVDSPQPDAGSARTCNAKPDPKGNALNIIGSVPLRKRAVGFL